LSLKYISGLNNDKTIDNFVQQYLTVVSETMQEYACYCPFHDNASSPAFYINKKTGLWHCFNPSCGVKGSFATLAKKLAGEEISWNYAPHYSDIDLMSMLDNSISSSLSIPQDWDAAMDRIFVDYDDPESVDQLSYLIDRGFSVDTLRYFDVGFSDGQNRIVIPARNEFFSVVGFIGRSLSNENYPKYLYSDKFPRRNTLFNLQNAKSHSEVIVTEGSLDAMRVHQAGHPNVVATLGASIPKEHIEMLGRYFDSIILFLDNDDAGISARDAIIEGNPRKDLWIVPYPSGVKDPGEMTEIQINESLDNKINYLDYLFKHKGEI